jgi:hypothetical protein
MFLRKALHLVMNGDETKNTAFDHSNLPTANAPGTASKVTRFHTEVDSERRQHYEYNAVVTPPIGQASDYMEQKAQIKGSILQGAQQYYQNWVFCDNWMAESTATCMAPSETLGGLDLRCPKGQRKYDWVGTEMITGNPAIFYNHYTIFVCTKVMHVMPNDINMSGTL